MSRRHRPLPAALPAVFSLAEAYALGVGPGRLRGADLSRPFHGVRAPARTDEGEPDVRDQERLRRRVTDLMRMYAPRMRPGQFFCRSSAAVALGAPITLKDDRLHVAVFDNAPIPRTEGVVGHRVRSGMASVRMTHGLPVTSPATTFAMNGHLSVPDLVTMGDFFCRVWREGVGRRHAGRPALATVGQLRDAITAGRRLGASRLREAVELVRTDSWSPRESATRVAIVRSGLPEPDLNVEVFDRAGRFIACVDMAYPGYRIAVEYQGSLHAAQYAQDVERFERLRADGWESIQVTAELMRNAPELVARVRRALLSRGWYASVA